LFRSRTRSNRGESIMPFIRTPAPQPIQAANHAPTGPPESAHIATRLAEVNHQLEQLDAQRTSLQRDHDAVTARYDAAVVADVQGHESEDPAVLRTERDRTEDKLVGNERLRNTIVAERDRLNERCRLALAKERHEAILRAFEEGKTKLTDQATRIRQAYAALCTQLAEINLTLDTFYGDFAEVGGPQFAGGMAEEVNVGNVALEQVGWRYVAGRGSVPHLMVVPMMPQRGSGPA
jgi:hypothetical protein